ncbi:MAG: hypothetical protein KDE26_14495 [Bacteroidetes bacterium]|nr:hypothetical protein [Bacteroidota bacterium]
MMKLEDFKKVKLSDNKQLSYIYGGAKVSLITGSSDPSRVGKYDKENADGGYDLSSQEEDSTSVGWS